MESGQIMPYVSVRRKRRAKTVTFILSAMLLFTGLALSFGLLRSKAAEVGQVAGIIGFQEYLNPSNRLEMVVRLLDVSRADASATLVSQEELGPITESSVPFVLRYPMEDIQPTHRYVIVVDAYLETEPGVSSRVFRTTENYPVLTRGAGRGPMQIRLERIAP